MASHRAGSDQAGGGGVPAAGSGLRNPDLRLGEGGEFDLIRSFYAGARMDRDEVRVGPGDDACVLRDGVVLTVDLSIEGVHFRREWLEPGEIGFRAAAAALSDLAAMAAAPVGVLVSLALAEEDRPRAGELMAGVRSAVETVNGVLLGGDLTRSIGSLVLDIVAVGRTQAPVLRSGAAPGDELWVTGDLGGAALAVAVLSAGGTPDPDTRRRFATPVPRTAEAAWLAERGIPAAMLDLSDGLAGDLSHLARASGVAAVIEAERVPIHSRLRGANPLPATGAANPQAALQLALGGGEDYELCFAARPGTVQPHLAEFRARFGIELSRVGRAERGEGVHLQREGGPLRRLHAAGYQHFGGAE